VDLTTPQFLVAWAIAGATAIAVFFHANRHQIPHSTAWGIGVFLILGLALPAYIVYYVRFRRLRSR
jgi:hypothetical protein